jgi:hypothetical protein
MVTQLTKLVRLYSCHNVTLKVAGIPAETCWREHWNKIHQRYLSEFVGYLYILDLPLCSFCVIL